LWHAGAPPAPKGGGPPPRKVHIFFRMGKKKSGRSSPFLLFCLWVCLFLLIVCPFAKEGIHSAKPLPPNPLARAGNSFWKCKGFRAGPVSPGPQKLNPRPRGGNHDEISPVGGPVGFFNPLGGGENGPIFLFSRGFSPENPPRFFFSTKNNFFPQLGAPGGGGGPGFLRFLVCL